MIYFLWKIIKSPGLWLGFFVPINQIKKFYYTTGIDFVLAKEN